MQVPFKKCRAEILEEKETVIILVFKQKALVIGKKIDLGVDI